MQKILMTLALLLSVCVAQAQTSDDEMTKEIKKTIELQNATKTFSDNLKTQMQPLVSQGLLSEEKLSSVISELEKIIIPPLMERTVAIYKEHFTLEEMKEMNAFFASPIGQKAIMLTPVLAQESAKIAQQPEVQSKLQQLVMGLLQR